jgi:hypothetical protein
MGNENVVHCGQSGGYGKFRHFVLAMDLGSVKMDRGSHVGVWFLGGTKSGWRARQDHSSRQSEVLRLFGIPILA